MANGGNEPVDRSGMRQPSGQTFVLGAEQGRLVRSLTAEGVSVVDVRGYYALLGVDRTATAADIKRAFYAKAKALHPDSGELGDAIAFQAVRDAYQVLGNRRRRAAYDQAGEEMHLVGQDLLWIARPDEPEPLDRRFSWGIAALLLIVLAALIGLAELAWTGRHGTAPVARYDSAEPTGPPAVSRFDAETDAAAAETLAVPAAPPQPIPHRPAR
jgi:curved DNA-binding protein CbpA